MDKELVHDAPVKTNSALNKEHHALAQWGNYRNYYFHRAAVVPDGRLSLLQPSLFKDKRVLDLGCNAGKLTIESVTHLGASSSHGIDIDPVLISQAATLLSQSPTELTNITFLQADFMSDAPTFFSSLHHKFDTILLLSITKWLHLHAGDDGLLTLFKALYECLPPGGTLVVEPQEWENYKTACKKNRNLKPVFKTLKIRPPFEEEFKEIEFRLAERIEREEGGFSRPLLVWVKDGKS